MSIISEIEFAARYTNAKIIGITGSNGKTTTTLIVGHMLKKAGLNVGIAGNVGDSFALQVANESHDFYVLELSSFQLDGIDNFKPHIAILLNIARSFGQICQQNGELHSIKNENYYESNFRRFFNLLFG